MFRIEQNGGMSLGRPKPPTKGGSAPDEEEEVFIQVVTVLNFMVLTVKHVSLRYVITYFLIRFL